MIVVARTPLRISLGGGGTDLPFYSRRFGGDVLSMAISPHVTVIAGGGRLDNRFKSSFEKLSVADSPEQLGEPYVRAAMDLVGFTEPCEIVSMGPIPAGTGLGSSGAFSVGLLAALNTLAGKQQSRVDLVDQACALEVDRLGRPVGKHDQYICGLGGLRRLIFDPSGRVTATEPRVQESTVGRLVDRLLLFYTGVRRDSASCLAPPTSDVDTAQRIEQLHRIRKIGDLMRSALETGDLDWVAELMREHWAVKRGQAKPSSWDELYEVAIAHGARAGKLVGAGGGGFLLVFVDPERRQDIIKAANTLGAQAVPFDFSSTGTTVTRIDTHATEVLL